MISAFGVDHAGEVSKSAARIARISSRRGAPKAPHLQRPTIPGNAAASTAPAAATPAGGAAVPKAGFKEKVAGWKNKGIDWTKKNPGTAAGIAGGTGLAGGAIGGTYYSRNR